MLTGDAKSSLMDDIREMTAKIASTAPENVEVVDEAPRDENEEAEKVLEIASSYPSEPIVTERVISDAITLAHKRGELSLWVDTSRGNSLENPRFDLKYMRTFPEVGFDEESPRTCIEQGTVLSWRPKVRVEGADHARSVAAQFSIAAQVVDALINANRSEQDYDESKKRDADV